MGEKTKVALSRVVFDISCISCAGFPVLILYLFANPYKRGFYCDDESLMHPYRSYIVPSWLAGFVSFALPSVLILTIEAIKARPEFSMNVYVVNCYKFIMPFFFGAGLSELTTFIAKFTVGRLRPHFLTVCKPSIPCTLTTGYIETDVCTGDKALIEEARLSFPSGHTSLAVFCMIWLSVYLQYNFIWKQYWLLRPGFQALSLFLAYYCGLSRISDYTHHWSDVLAGAINGTIIGVLNVFFMSNLLPDNKKGSKKGPNGLPVYKTHTKPGSEKTESKIDCV